MALNNPLYFLMSNDRPTTLPGPSSRNNSKFLFFNKYEINKGASLSSPTNSSIDSNVSDGSNSVNVPPIPPYGIQIPQSRRALRTLLRSVSANSTESNQELLIMGQPRPSDIAPPSSLPENTPFIFDPPEKFPRRCRSLRKTNKSSTELLHEDLVYCPLAMSDNEADKVSEEVFLTETSAHYYNISSVPRRHSIGTSCYARDRNASVSTTNSYKGSFQEDIPHAIIHATADGEPITPVTTPISVGENGRPGSVAGSTTSSQLKTKCNRCAPKKATKTGRNVSASAAAMDDILILFSAASEAASLWAPYLNVCFDQISQQRSSRHPLKVFHLTLEEITSGIDSALEERIAAVKLQIVILCPTILNQITDVHVENGESILARILHPNKVLAMLLGVAEASLTEHHKKVLTSYYHWKRIVIKDQDQTVASELLDAAMTIIGRIARQQNIVAQQEKAQFSVIPKKVKVGQRRIIVLLNEPLQKDDNVKVNVDKSLEMIEITAVKKRNPYTLQFLVPESCFEVSMMINVVVEKNGSILGNQPIKCESRLRELDQLLRSNDNPMEFMCQTLGFSSTNHEHIDNFLVQSFQRNLPPHFNLLTPPPSCSNSISTQQRIPEEYPTLLHFAARFGLEKLAWQLLECPGGEQACELRNICELTPAEVAENSGHSNLAHTLRGYMQMNEFSNMYHILKGMSETKPKPGPSMDEYLLPRPIDETYRVPPSARVFNPNPIPLIGYMEMNSPHKSSNSQLPTLDTSEANLSTSSPVDRFTEVKASLKADRKNRSLKKADSISLKSQMSTEDPVQGELVDIINDFKNNVFTIQEVEKLVDNWRNRNDVLQSFKDKQEALKKMRDEYERIQKLMKGDFRRSPFDRFKKFFSRGKSKNNLDEFEHNTDLNETSHNDKVNGVDKIGCQNRRPISSLSCQSISSSSSSTRMSTSSGCSGISFGDSGTHSDIEERKHLFNFPNHNNNIEHDKTGNYLIPPAPKPIYKPGSGRMSPQTSWKFATIEERLPLPIPRNDEGDKYYIQFPPSGLPVNTGFDPKLSQIIENESHIDLQPEYLEFENENVKKNQEYINFAAIEAHEKSTDLDEEEEESKLLPEYMNFKNATVVEHTHKFHKSKVHNRK